MLSKILLNALVTLEVTGEYLLKGVDAIKK
jgi:hypothetical protein